MTAIIMKPELTPELKERFFAQYWDQRIVGAHGYKNEYLSKCHPSYGKSDDFFLRLRPMSSITDEEVKEALAMCGYTSNRQTRKAVREELVKGFSCIQVNEDSSIEIDLEAYDYLRSLGFALPFAGRTVDELLEAGWIKLTDNAQDK